MPYSDDKEYELEKMRIENQNRNRANLIQQVPLIAVIAACAYCFKKHCECKQKNKKN